MSVLLASALQRCEKLECPSQNWCSKVRHLGSKILRGDRDILAILVTLVV